jgi:hypothetical protein
MSQRNAATPRALADWGKPFMKEQEMKKYPLILASAVLLVTSGVASAQSRTRIPDPYGAGPRTTGQGGVTHAPSSSNPQQTAPNGLLQAPHGAPENGGAPMRDVPRRTR